MSSLNFELFVIFLNPIPSFQYCKISSSPELLTSIDNVQPGLTDRKGNVLKQKKIQRVNLLKLYKSYSKKQLFYCLIYEVVIEMSIENENSNRFSPDKSNLADNKTLPQRPVTEGEIEEPTDRINAPTEEDFDNDRTAFENDSTKILPEASQVFSEELPAEDAAAPFRLRHVFVGILFLFVSGWLFFNIYYHVPFSSDHNLERAFEKGKVIYVVHKELRENDEIISINDVPWTEIKSFYETYYSLEPNEAFTLRVKRGGNLVDVELMTKPLPVDSLSEFYINGIVVPAIFLFVGLAVFLLKPNYQPAFLVSVAFILCSMMTVREYMWINVQALPLIPALWIKIGVAVRVTVLFLPFFLHLFLIFPERLKIVRRFPNFKKYVYVPYLIFVILPLFSTEVDSVFRDLLPIETVFIIVYGAMFLYLLAALTALLSGYRQINPVNRRRIRIMVAGVVIACIPALMMMLFNVVIVVSKGLYYSIFDNFGSFYRWLIFSSSTALIFIPLAFAYAIIQHRVIPVSFVLRRGVQYLLAKNALRILLVLPVLGIIWNIVSDPNRTLSQILFQNSLSFYLFITAAVIDGLLMRSRLNEWIDRRFFREQYNQEKILRELTEAVKESASLLKLSRLASSKIQLALHPENVYLFFRDDARQSDFSLGYTTTGANEHSSDLKIAADSRLLRFMQQQRGAVEFPTARTGELPDHEKNWLREMGANLLVPMHGTDGKLAGIFLLGEKLSEIPYTGRDKELLEILADQIALVHENLSLKDRMRREQKIKHQVLARFDAGQINLLQECPTCGRCFDREAINCDIDHSELTFSLPVERTIEDRYRLEKLIGRGGMGAVYEALDLRLNRRVAVKILSGAMFGNREALRRFEREAQTAGRLQHSNVVTVHDYGTLSTEGAFLVMELVTGESLRSIFHRQGTLKVETVKEWFSQILDGVEAAHKAGIIHRDLKPDNIIVERNRSGMEKLCILDFGLARLSGQDVETVKSVTIPGTIMGTLGYMAPEQLRGEKADERSDLFAVGVIIYEAIKGAKPFQAQSFHELVRVMDKKISFDFERQFNEFFEKALARDPEKRFPTAARMRQALREACSPPFRAIK